MHNKSNYYTTRLLINLLNFYNKTLTKPCINIISHSFIIYIKYIKIKFGDVFLFMYLIFLLLLIFALLGILFFDRRKKIICNKIRLMKTREKIDKINELIDPFGYYYNCNQDIFSTTINAWQREFGYTEFYNKNAHRLNIIFDSKAIYFDYNNQTWLIEFWKGQYGINAGCEVGIYCHHSLVPKALHNYTLFKSVDNEDMLPITISLFTKEYTIAKLRQKHWWLTIFDLGKYTEPSELSMNIGITFPNREMMNSFIDGLLDEGYKKEDIFIRGTKVYFLFDKCTTCSLNLFYRLRLKYIQFKNRSFCKLFLKITKPFNTSLDKALCVYYLIPIFFRRIFVSKRYKICNEHRKNKICKKCNKIIKNNN